MRFPPAQAEGLDEDRKNFAGTVVRRLNSSFETGRTKSYEFRKQQLSNLLRFLDENTDVLCKALEQDLKKPRHETIVTEIETVRNEILHALASLKKWMEPHPVEKSPATLVDSPFIMYEPYGTVLIIGAWNYPINVLLGPLVGAIAAGNCAIIKPSEVSSSTEHTVEKLLPQYLDKDCYEVVCCGPEETGLLLKEKFDYIFYTGSTAVGKIIYEAAAKHLTPVTLELGGKSPVFVDNSADIQLTARRIMWGKLINAGQTCIAPDYVLCTPDTQQRLVAAMKTVTNEFLSDPKQTDFCRIVSDRHFDRLKSLVSQQKVAFGGEFDAAGKYVSPTVLTDVDPESPIMKQEIFGPILPIVPVKDMDHAVSFVNSRDKPLALYVFSKDNKVSDKILKETSSGGACINDTIMHIALDSLPFGGVGGSGFGAYHGKHSFETFSHRRSVLWKKHGLEFLFSSRYPPYNSSKTKMSQALLKYRRPFPKWIGSVALFGVGVLSGYVIRFLINLQQSPQVLQRLDETSTTPM